MKNKNLVVTALFIFLAAGVFAQKGNMPQKNNMEKGMFMKIPDLTDAQQEKIKTLRTAHMKEMLPLKNDLREKQAHLQTLQTSDKQDMNAINKQIDDIYVVKTQMTKKHAALRQEVRKILTDDQRVWFDNNAGNMHKKGMNKKMMYKKSGNCPGMK